MCYCEDPLDTSDLRRNITLIPGASRPRSLSSSQINENDTNLEEPGLDSRRSLSTLSPYLYGLGVDDPAVTPRTGSDHGVKSPFEFGAFVLAALFNILGVLDPASMLSSQRFCPFICAVTDLPVCAYQQTSLFRTRLFASGKRFKSDVVSAKKSFHMGHLIGFLLLMIFLCIVCEHRCQVAQVAPFPRVVPTCLLHLPWQRMCNWRSNYTSLAPLLR